MAATTFPFHCMYLGDNPCVFFYLIFRLFIVLGHIIIIYCNVVIRFVLLRQFHRGAYRLVDISCWFVVMLM